MTLRPLLRNLVTMNTPQIVEVASNRVRTREEILDFTDMLPPTPSFGDVSDDVAVIEAPAFDDSYNISKSEAWGAVWDGFTSVYMPSEETWDGMVDAFNRTGVNINELAYNYENGINTEADPQFDLDARLEAMGMSALRKYYEGAWNAPRVVNEEQFEKKKCCTNN